VQKKIDQSIQQQKSVEKRDTKLSLD